MGMGDEKPKFKPFHQSMVDAVSGERYADISMRECLHPAVAKRYGNRVFARVSVYVCKRCEFGINTPFCDCWECGYNKSD